MTCTVCKHFQISCSHAFVRNNLNSCHIKLIFFNKIMLCLVDKEEQTRCISCLTGFLLLLHLGHSLWEWSICNYQDQCTAGKLYQKVLINSSLSNWHSTVFLQQACVGAIHIYKAVTQVSVLRLILSQQPSSAATCSNLHGSTWAYTRQPKALTIIVRAWLSSDEDDANWFLF